MKVARGAFYSIIYELQAIFHVQYIYNVGRKDSTLYIYENHCVCHALPPLFKSKYATRLRDI